MSKLLVQPCHVLTPRGSGVRQSISLLFTASLSVPAIQPTDLAFEYNEKKSPTCPRPLRVYSTSTESAIVLGDAVLLHMQTPPASRKRWMSKEGMSGRE